MRDIALCLTRADNYDGESPCTLTRAHLLAESAGDVLTIDDLEEARAGRWLIASAAEFRQTPATGGGA